MWCHDLAWLATNGTRCPVQTQPSGHLTTQVQAISTPNLWRVSKNSITKNCRATCDLQLCLNELGLIQAGFQIAKLWSMVHETVNQFLEIFLSLKIASGWFLGAIFAHVMHWISSWPLNKVCSPCHGLQLLLKVHSHANTLCYSSTLVKVGSWKNDIMSKLWLRSKIGPCHEYEHCFIYHPRYF